MSAITNLPYWTQLKRAHQASQSSTSETSHATRAVAESAGGVPKGFQEAWYLKLNDPSGQRALWLRFLILTSRDGFRQATEAWALYFSRQGSGREMQKVALKQTFPLSAFGEIQAGAAGSRGGEAGIRVDRCELTAHHTRGQITWKGNTFKWDLTMQPAGPQTGFHLIPQTLQKWKLIRTNAFTVSEDLVFSGTTELNGQATAWKDAPGMQGHLAGGRSGHSWVWAHGNTFVNEQGKPTPFVFEGLSGKARLPGGMALPRLSSLFFRYQGQDYRFNSLWDAIRSRSQHGLNEWTFRAERGDLVFSGRAWAEFRDFAGVTLEDTDGSLLYCSNSKLANLEIHVYRRGKLETTLTSPGAAALEVVSRSRNPYVPLLI